MPKTNIITTIGPSSLNDQTLSYFAKNSVKYARLNFSHSASDWHIQAGKECRKNGLELLIDLGGPKIRLGELTDNLELISGSKIVLEETKPDTHYPRILTAGPQIPVLPTALDLSKSLEAGREILIDDGKISLTVESIQDKQIFCNVTFGGLARSRKGINLPKSSLDIDFLTNRDKQMLQDTLLVLKPEIVACSFVKNSTDIKILKAYIDSLLTEAGETNYYPKIAAKIEQHEAVETEVLDDIIKHADLIMIARGDLALETTPAHILVPFYQEKIKQACRKQNKPFIVATQILESMIDCPVPTRAEMSDLYRAVVIDDADFVMLSGESAMGKFPTQCINLMHTLITESGYLNNAILA